MSKAKLVIAITGPAGSGKSIVAKLLSKHLENSVNIDADIVKHFIVSGFKYDETSEGVKQWQLLGENLGLLAKNFNSSGYNVIINGYINEPAWDKIADSVKLTHKFLLLPHLDTIIDRDQNRQDDFIMGEEAVKTHYDYFTNSSFYKDFTLIDSTELSEEEAVDKILESLT